MQNISVYLKETGQFFREVKAELSKVTFPTRQETVASTMVVLALTVLIAAFLGFSDWVLSRVVKMILHVG